MFYYIPVIDRALKLFIMWVTNTEVHIKHVTDIPIKYVVVQFLGSEFQHFISLQSDNSLAC